jgi:hypothetical protein
MREHESVAAIDVDARNGALAQSSLGLRCLMATIDSPNKKVPVAQTFCLSRSPMPVSQWAAVPPQLIPPQPIPPSNATAS